MDRVQERENEVLQECPSRPQMRPIKFSCNLSPLHCISSTPSIIPKAPSEETVTKKTVLNFLRERHSKIKEKGRHAGKENEA